MSEFGAAEFDDGLVLAQPPREHNMGNGIAKENIGFPLVGTCFKGSETISVRV